MEINFEKIGEYLLDILYYTASNEEINELVYNVFNKLKHEINFFIEFEFDIQLFDFELDNLIEFIKENVNHESTN